MSPDDLVVWRRFLEKLPDVFTDLRYNVRVGTGSKEWDDTKGPVPYEWLCNCAKRIDAVGEHDGVTCVIEVKPKGGMSALGQVLVYRDLYYRQEKPSNLLGCWVVCAEADNDCLRTYSAYGVKLIAVGS